MPHATLRCLNDVTTLVEVCATPSSATVNFSGTVEPLLTVLSTPPMSTGWKKPDSVSMRTL